MSNEPEGQRRSASDVQRDQAAMRDVVPAMVALVAVQGSLIALDPDGGASWANVAWALLPLVPFTWLVWAQVRSLRRADERQRILQLSAMATGFAVVMVIALAGGLLDGAGLGSPRQSLQLVFIGGTIAWLGSLGYLMRPSR